MPRKSLLLSAALVGLLAIAVSPTRSVQADAPLSPNDLKNYANELAQAFPGPVDLYLSTKDFDFARPSVSNVHIAGCSAIAGTLYYVIRHDNGSDSFVPQSQIVMIHNRK